MRWNYLAGKELWGDVPVLLCARGGDMGASLGAVVFRQVIVGLLKFLMRLLWGSRGRSSSALEVFKTSLELLACGDMSIRERVAVWWLKHLR